MPRARSINVGDHTANDLTSPTQVSIWLSKDTLERLDAIVERGHFGGRGRAIDALLDSLQDSVEDINLWNLAFRHFVSPTVTDPMTRQRFDDEMRMHATRVWGRLERFFELGEWDSPPLPIEARGVKDRSQTRRETAARPRGTK
jgi:hypothetical protein